MLSDEEKILTKKLRYCEQEYEQNGYLSVGKFEAIKEAVNLIEKQSKEIEELEREKAIYYYEWRHLEANVINKIQEYDDKGMTVNLVNRSAGKTFQQAVHYEVKKVLQSLLEKE